MDRIRSNARHAGLLYLMLAIIAPFSLSYVPALLAEAGGASAATIATDATLLRLSLASELFYQVLEIFIVLALFELFRGAQRKLALQMLVLGLLPIPIVFLNQLPAFGAIVVATAQGALATTAPAARDAAVVFLYDLHTLGLVLASVFWGLWLFPLGRLIIASSYLPSLLGWSVIVGGLGYVIRAIAVLVLPSFFGGEAVRAVMQVSEIMLLGEVPVIVGLLWLGFWKATDPVDARV